MKQEVERVAFSMDEAAVSLGVARKTLQKLISENGLPSCRVGHRRFVPVRELKEWLARKCREEAAGDDA